MFILKHGTREDKPFLRSAIISVTGLDISCNRAKRREDNRVFEAV